MKKKISIILASFLIAPFTFGYESCITPKKQKVDLYGAVREITYKDYDWRSDQRIIRQETYTILKLRYSICIISDEKKDKSKVIYDERIALIPSAGMNLSEMINQQVEIQGVLVASKTTNNYFPISIVVESIKIIK